LPLTRIRQVAASTVLGLLTGVMPTTVVQAADPAQTPSTSSQAVSSSAPPPASNPEPAASPAPQPAASRAPQPAAVPAPQPPALDQPVLLPPKATAQIVHSALLTVDGTATDDSVRLSIRRTHDKSLVTGGDGDISVTIDGKKEPVTHERADIFEIPINDLHGDGSADNAHDVEIIVPHDGIREILSGKLTATQTSSGSSLLGDHKQMAWWVLNIAIVFIAATVLSRRKRSDSDA
jgi:hypothetical protein